MCQINIMAYARDFKACGLFVRRWRNIGKYHGTTFLSPSTLTSSSQDQNFKPFAEVPGPVSFPLIGTTWTFLVGARSERFGKRLLPLQQKHVQKYGHIHKHRLGGRYIVHLADPSDVAKVLRTESKFPQRVRIPILDYYLEKQNRVPGVFFSDGPEWYRHRSVLNKRMLRPNQVADYAAAFNEIITDFIQRLRTVREPSGSDKVNEVCGLDNELFKWSFESVALILFDKRFGCLEPQVNEEAQTFINAVGEFLGSIASVSLFPLWFLKIYKTEQLKKFYRGLDKMYQYAELFIERRLNEIDVKSSESSKSDNSTGFFEFLLSSGKINKDDVLASVIDVLFAGVDTTSNTMQWILYMMAKNPEKQDVLRQEVLSVLGDKAIATPTTLAKMPYIKAWVRETLRLYPAVRLLFRVLPDDVIIRGFHIPAGTQVNMLLYFMSRDESIFPDSEEFKPDRWLRDKAETSKFNDARDVFSSLPFGFGTRMCLGRRIAELELYLLLARIVQHFEICYPPGEIAEPFARGVIIPDRPLRVQFVDRQKK